MNQTATAKELTKLLGCAPDDLPTLPMAAWELTRLTSDPEAEIEDMVRVISQDPPLGARLLKMANTPVFRTRMGGPLTDLSRAIMILGFKELGNLALGLSVFSVFRDGKSSMGRNLQMSLWRHSVVVGLLTEIIARDYLGLGSGYYSFGLVHDIGKLALGARRPDQFARAMGLMKNKGLSWSQAEADTMGYDHALVGGRLMAFWNLPVEMVTAAGCHHQPDSGGEHTRLAALVCAADALAVDLGYGITIDEDDHNPPSPTLTHAARQVFEQEGIAPSAMLENGLDMQLEQAMARLNEAGLIG